MKSWLKYIQENMSLPNALMAFGLSNVPLTTSDLKKLYKKLVVDNHPDRGGSTEKMSRINVAYEVLLKEVGGKKKNSSDSEDIFNNWREKEAKRKEIFNQMAPTITKEYQKTVKPESYVKYFEKLFGEKFILAKNLFVNHFGLWSSRIVNIITIENSDKTKIFRLEASVDMEKMLDNNKPILSANDLDLDVDTTIFIVYKRKDIKLSQSRWNWKKAKASLTSPEMLFPEKKILKQFKKSEGKKIQRKDVIRTIEMEFDARYHDTNTYKMLTGDENYYALLYRSTFLRMGSWQIIVFQKQGMGGKNTRLAVSFYEKGEYVDLFYDTLKKLKKANNFSKIQKVINDGRSKKDELRAD